MPSIWADTVRSARRLYELLEPARATLSVAESLTGGRLAAVLAEAPGAYGIFQGSVTAYSTGAKRLVLRVPADLLAVRGPVDPEVACRMARGVRLLMRTTYALATTGVAGPAPQDGIPPGTVYVALAAPGGARATRLRLAGGREAVQHATVAAALALLREHLREEAATARRPR